MREILSIIHDVVSADANVMGMAIVSTVRHEPQRVAALVDDDMGDVFYQVCHGVPASTSRLHGNAWRRRFALASPASAFVIKSYSNASG